MGKEAIQAGRTAGLLAAILVRPLALNSCGSWFTTRRAIQPGHGSVTERTCVRPIKLKKGVAEPRVLISRTVWIEWNIGAHSFERSCLWCRSGAVPSPRRAAPASRYVRAQNLDMEVTIEPCELECWARRISSPDR